jgi:LL-diaminopimelate aminotransferase
MFGLGKSIAAQDPSYPVYVDTSVMMGNTGLHNGKGFDNIEYMVCTPENNFFPDLANVSVLDCTAAASTGAVMQCPCHMQSCVLLG